MTDPTLDEMLEIAKQRNEENERLYNEMKEKKEFFLYYVIDYMGTGEGRTIYLFIERNEEGVLRSLKQTVDPFYFDYIEQVSEEKFFNYYSNLIPAQVKATIESRNVPSLSFQQMYHFNYS